MYRNLKIIFVFLLILTSCDDHSLDCKRGRVIAYEPCTDATVIAIKGLTIGRDLKIYDPYLQRTVAYKNVIKVPGAIAAGDYYFNLRKYVKEQDDHLFSETQICYAVYAPYPVPIFVVEAYSTSPCD